jgi:hypothetical protein
MRHATAQDDRAQRSERLARGLRKSVGHDEDEARAGLLCFGDADVSHLHEIGIECAACTGATKGYDRGDKEETSAHALPNDIEFSGEKEGAQRLTPSPLQ